MDGARKMFEEGEIENALAQLDKLMVETTQPNLEEDDAWKMLLNYETRLPLMILIDQISSVIAR